MALAKLVATAKARWRVEQDYRELKAELGMDHFEDETLIGTPRYNFTVPANLKAWIASSFAPGLLTPVRLNAKVWSWGNLPIIIASGGTYDEGLPAAASDHVSGYLKRVLGFIGITDVAVVLAGGMVAVSFGATTLEELASRFRPAVLAAAG